MVLLISLGITTLPRSSILLTIPVAFIYHKSPLFSFGTKVFCVNKGFLCKEKGGSYEDINHSLTYDFFSKNFRKLVLFQMTVFWWVRGIVFWYTKNIVFSITMKNQKTRFIYWLFSTPNAIIQELWKSFYNSNSSSLILLPFLYNKD